jgi:hypothetical protein
LSGNSSDSNAWAVSNASKPMQNADYQFGPDLSSIQIASFCEACEAPEINKQLDH